VLTPPRRRFKQAVAFEKSGKTFLLLEDIATSRVNVAKFFCGAFFSKKATSCLTSLKAIGASERPGKAEYARLAPRYSAL
jgi:hypothetical protein